MNSFDFTKPTYDGLQMIWQKCLNMMPQLFAGIILLLLGIVIAIIIKKAVSRMLTKTRFDQFINDIGIGRWIAQLSIQQTPSTLFGNLIGLFILLIFGLTAVDSMGLKSLSSLLDTFTLFLPKLFAALVVLIVGCSIAQGIFTAVKSATQNMGIDYGRSVAEVVRGMVIVVSLSLAISQLEVDVTLLNWMIGVICASVGLGVAISLGLGTRSLSQEIIAGVYLREMYEPGDDLSVGDIQGKLALIGTVSVKIVNSDDAIVSLPNSHLLRRPVVKTPAQDT